jgi:hypothetical protein
MAEMGPGLRRDDDNGAAAVISVRFVPLALASIRPTTVTPDGRQDRSLD